MDLQQTKLTKTEWNNTEIPVQEDEQFILKLIKDGFTFDIGPTWYWMPDVFERFFGDFDKIGLVHILFF
jgi:hypothetical protein